MTLFIDLVGWGAMILLLTAYALLSLGRVGAHTYSYQLMNIVGSAGFILNSGWKGAYPSAGLNVAWLIIGLGGLYYHRARRAPSSTPDKSA